MPGCVTVFTSLVMTFVGELCSVFVNLLVPFISFVLYFAVCNLLQAALGFSRGGNKDSV